MGTGSGSYYTQRDGGLEYQYDVTWDRFGRVVIWSARVRKAGESFSVIDGQVNVADDVNLEAAVRRLVESSIEHRVGVD